MANVMGRRVNWGDALVQRSDGTWASDWTMEVHDDEALPQTEDELRIHLRRFAARNPAADALARAAEAGKPNDHAKNVAIGAALVGSANPFVRALLATRGLKANPV